MALGIPGLSAQVSHGDDFVQRDGTRLTLAGEPFRYSGPNIEWLGLEGYGPHDPAGARFPKQFEIDDAFATAEEMGARVVRSQTMGDTVGCDECIEPKVGVFNEANFQSIDYAISVARAHGMRLIITLNGDCAACRNHGGGPYLDWANKQGDLDFFTDPRIVGAVKKHIDAVLEHRNAITGVLYKDDPTIMAWENCNMCGLRGLYFSGDKNAGLQIAKWVEEIGAYIKQQDPRHLYLDTSGIFPSEPSVLAAPSVDMVTYEYYPHWQELLGKIHPMTMESIRNDAATITSHGKVFIVNEYGWDKTDWKTLDDLKTVLHLLETDHNISGDGFWALQAHLEYAGMQPIPADVTEPAAARDSESGEWWALYYPGRTTRVMTAQDMAARAQMLRTHAYAMRGMAAPKHAVPPKPLINAVVGGWIISFRGSACAVSYSVEEKLAGSAEWKTICDKCATDFDDPWAAPQRPLRGSFRVIAWNADGVPSAPSDPW